MLFVTYDNIYRPLAKLKIFLHFASIAVSLRKNSSPMESLNRIAKDLKRNARGFRNFEHLRNRFLFAERKNAQILASPLPPEKYKEDTGIKRGPYNKKQP